MAEIAGAAMPLLLDEAGLMKETSAYLLSAGEAELLEDFLLPVLKLNLFKEKVAASRVLRGRREENCHIGEQKSTTSRVFDRRREAKRQFGEKRAREKHKEMLRMAAKERGISTSSRAPLLLLLVAYSAIFCISFAAANPPAVLPGCPDDCGNGVLISYPFGIGSNCSRNSDFEVTCIDNRPYLRGLQSSYEVTIISLQTNEVRILTQVSQICNESQVREYYGGILYEKRYITYSIPASYEFSHAKNKLTAVGCNAFGALAIPQHSSVALGCLATCENQTDKLLTENSCSGYGCCQTTIPADLFDVIVVLRKINNATLPWLENSSNDADNSRSCGYVFMVEAANYTFKRSHLSWQGNHTFPVVLEWYIRGMTCEEAQNDKSSFACKSRNSMCYNISGRVGSNDYAAKGYNYYCNCSRGYQGNPYLEGGCQDINECAEPDKYPCNGICVNTPGSYNCRDPPSPLGPKSNTKIGVIVGLSSGICALMLFVCGTMLFRIIQKKKLKMTKDKFFRYNYNLLIQQQQMSPSSDENLVDKVKFFSLKDIEKATNNFDSSRIIGQGGHGTVYKGLFELKVVAIKKPKLIIEDEIKEFLNEVILLSQISHKNVVQLIGCCLETRVPLLVYEFISNGTLSDHLHTRHQESPLPWEDRLRIATEISAGLAYLHNAAIISVLHRDIKSANILLDERLTAKISDFGASKTIEVDQTHISTNVQGTLGYLDPEYMHTGQLTDKSDVYSLGVILVELLTRERPTSRIRAQEERHLISHFTGALKEDRLFEVVDDVLLDYESKGEIEVVAKLAVDCLSMRGKDRPAMKDIEMILQGLAKKKKKTQQQPRTMYVKSEIMTSGWLNFPLNGRATGEESTNHDSMEECAIPLKSSCR